MELSKPAALMPIYPIGTAMSRQQFKDAVMIAMLANPQIYHTPNYDCFKVVEEESDGIADARERQMKGASNG